MRGDPRGKAEKMYKIVKLSWTDNDYAIVKQNKAGGWEYVNKYIDIKTAQNLLASYQ